MGDAAVIRWLGHSCVQVDLDGTRVLTDPALTARLAHLRRHHRVDVGHGRRAGCDRDLPRSHGPPARAIAAAVRSGDPHHRACGCRAAAAAQGLPERRRGQGRDTFDVGRLTVETVPRRPPARPRPAQPHRRRRRRLRAARPAPPPCTSPATRTCSTRWPTWAAIDVALLPIWGWGPTIGEGHLDPERAAEPQRRCCRPALVVPVHWGTYSPIGVRRGRPSGWTRPSHQFADALARRRHRRRAARARARRIGWPSRSAAPAPDGRSPREATPTRSSGRPRATELGAGRRPRCGRHARPRRSPCGCSRSLLGGFSIDRPRDALLAGFVVGLLNAVVWPALAFVVVPLSVLTLGLGAIVLDALFVGLVLDELPGVEIDGFWTALVIVIGLAVITTIVSSVLALDDDAWFDQRMARRARRRAKGAAHTDVPGVVFVQLDGVAEVVLRPGPCGRATCPTLHRWLRDGTHRLVGWETGWSSQTGVSQCGILHGSIVDMPAFRWVDKADGDGRRVQPARVGGGDRARPLRRQRPARPPRLELRQPVLRRRRAGRADDERRRQAQGGPHRRRLLRLLLAAAAGDADADRRRRRGRPRAAGRPAAAPAATSSRGSSAAGRTRCCARSRRSSAATSRCRACSTTCARAGRRSTSTCSATTRSPTTPVPSGSTRWPCCATSTARSPASTARSQWAPRPYKLVVLSDHGQTQGATFSSARARRWPSSSPGCAAAPHRATPTPSRARPSRRPGCARPATDDSAPGGRLPPSRSCSARAASA